MFVARRLLALFPTLLAASLLVFWILKLVPGDPAIMLAGADATDAQIENVRNYFHLNDPLYVQYGHFLAQALQGDLGQSLRTRQPVIQELAQRLPASLELAFAGIVIAALVGTAIGVTCAFWQYSLWDNLLMVLSVAGISMPIFWLGLMLILLFSVELGWLPTGGSTDWRGLVLPGVTLGLSSGAIVARQTRSAMLEVLNADFIVTARSKGLAEWLVISRHALKNAAIPTVTVLGLQLGNLLGGVIVTETVFAWPGLGRLILESISFRDIPVVQGGVLLLATVFLLINLVVDLIYGYLDPRISLA